MFSSLFFVDASSSSLSSPSSSLSSLPTLCSDLLLPTFCYFLFFSCIELSVRWFIMHSPFGSSIFIVDFLHRGSPTVSPSPSSTNLNLDSELHLNNNMSPTLSPSSGSLTLPTSPSSPTSPSPKSDNDDDAVLAELASINSIELSSVRPVTYLSAVDESSWVACTLHSAITSYASFVTLLIYAKIIDVPYFDNSSSSSSSHFQAHILSALSFWSSYVPLTVGYWICDLLFTCVVMRNPLLAAHHAIIASVATLSAVVREPCAANTANAADVANGERECVSIMLVVITTLSYLCETSTFFLSLRSHLKFLVKYTRVFDQRLAFVKPLFRSISILTLVFWIVTRGPLALFCLYYSLSLFSVPDSAPVMLYIKLFFFASGLLATMLSADYTRKMIKDGATAFVEIDVNGDRSKKRTRPTSVKKSQ